ncbi:MAG: ribonuclease HI family protein [Candidatus Krumholzibacteriales bacterium]
MKKLSRFIEALALGEEPDKARDKAGYRDNSEIEKDLYGVIERIRGVKAETGSAMPEYLTVNCDGASSGNPGPSAAAAVAYLPSGDILTSRTEKLGKTTNNVAEYRAAILGLELARDLNVRKVVLKIDSQLVVNQMNGKYKIKSDHLRELALKAGWLSRQFDSCEFRHIGRDQNREADKLARGALRKKRD